MIAISQDCGVCSITPKVDPATARLILAANQSSHILTQIDVSLHLVEELKSRAVTSITATGLTQSFSRVLSRVLKANGILLEVTS